ncbi:MAG: AbrB/MazE/SpoVT family DNA-binding domain-containing protein [Deltaproteobacteria bacterium]|nr:AbrB/MazE/SpoVT family DNA-binding domain-containing protein [Deltaproteobacteria bacterium]
MPAEIRERFGLVSGTAVEFLVREGEVVLRKDRQTREPVDRVFGTLTLPKSVDALVDELRGPRPARIAKRRARRR